jgi:uncharacterized protein YndB with AHSA1/START domain
MSESVTLEWELSAPIEQVWQALTDSTMLSRWMLFEASDFEPTVGHRFQLRGKPETGWTGVVTGAVLEAERPCRLAYTWETEGQLGPHQTTVIWTLTESEPGATHLHVEQRGFDPAARREIGGAKYGWTHQLRQLDTMLQAGGDGPTTLS